MFERNRRKKKTRKRKRKRKKQREAPPYTCLLIALQPDTGSCTAPAARGSVARIGMLLSSLMVGV
jgi:hypothetical protein